MNNSRVREINGQTVNKRLMKGLFAKMGAGLQEAMRDDKMLKTSSLGHHSCGRRRGLSQGPVKSTGTRKGLGQEPWLSGEEPTQCCPTADRQQRNGSGPPSPRALLLLPVPLSRKLE